MDRRTLLGMSAGLAASAAMPAWAQRRVSSLQWPAKEHFPLWPGKAPGAPAKLPVLERFGPDDGRELWLRSIPEPTVSVFRPAKPNGIGVLSIPGGGYGFVSVENEGYNVAKALNPLGFTVFALTYRLPGDGWANRASVPLQDAQRTMRLIRSRAASFGIDPKRLGILGFSAGGHLGATLSTAYDDRVYEAVDAADRQSARPDFSGLIYPVTSAEWDGKLNGSGQNLLGMSVPEETVARYDAVKRVTPQTPPLFFVHAADDGLVPLEMSIAMIAAARLAKLPVSAHFYEKGGHGFGMALDPAHPAHGWGDLYAAWVRRTTGG